MFTCDPPEVGHCAGSVTVMDADAPVGVIPLAQWISRRILSTATRADCCAWKRSFIWNSAFVAWTKRTVSPVRTTLRIAATWTSSSSE